MLRGEEPVEKPFPTEAQLIKAAQKPELPEPGHYMPTKGTGSYAILLALYRDSIKPDYKGFCYIEGTLCCLVMFCGARVRARTLPTARRVSRRLAPQPLQWMCTNLTRWSVYTLVTVCPGLSNQTQNYGRWFLRLCLFYVREALVLWRLWLWHISAGDPEMKR